MSLSSAFRAVGNDPGIITWRIEVSRMGITPTLMTGIRVASEGQHQGQVFPALCSVQVPKQNQACPSSSHLLGESALPVNTSERCLPSPEILGGWSEKQNIIIIGTLVPTSLGWGGTCCTDGHCSSLYPVGLVSSGWL